MPTNKSIDTYISDYELYHIYKKMYDEKHLGFYWFARDSQPWKRMNQIKSRIISKGRYTKHGVNKKRTLKEE